MIGIVLRAPRWATSIPGAMTVRKQAAITWLARIASSGMWRLWLDRCSRRYHDSTAAPERWSRSHRGLVLREPLSRGGDGNLHDGAPYNEKETTMAGQKTVAAYVIVMIALIVAIDFLFFRNRFRERLAVNAGIVLIFAACYFRFLARP
jgi:hypothetical protein